MLLYLDIAVTAIPIVIVGNAIRAGLDLFP